MEHQETDQLLDMPSLSSTSEYWRSLEELAETSDFKDFLHREFPVAASEFPTGVSRRRWLQLMGASLALGGLSGCRWPQEKIAPFAVRPENRMPGVPQKYATAHEVGGYGRALLVSSYDGRPIKVEGNPQHPASLGATDVFDQASILQLYDPDRSRTLQQSDGNQRLARTWNEFEQFAKRHFNRLREKQGEKFCILAESSSSPSRERLRKRLTERFPQMRWYEYEAVSRWNETAGSRIAFGKAIRTHLRLKASKIVLCLDADPLGDHPDATRYIRDWASSRSPESGSMSRLYVAESQFSITGSNADHRLPIRSADIPELLHELESRLKNQNANRLERPAADAGSFREKFLKALLDDLLKHRGQSIIAVGPVQPPEVHAAAHRLNAMLQNAGSTVVYSPESDATPQSHGEKIRELSREMREGVVDTLVILGGNPIHNTPVDVEFDAGLKKVRHSIHLSTYDDETSSRCRWHLPRTHAFESWGDTRTFDGTVTAIQPLIKPLCNGRSEIELLALLIGEDTTDGEAIVKATFKTRSKDEQNNDRWDRFLHDGFVKRNHQPAGPPKITSPEAKIPDKRRSESAIELVFTPSPTIYDGRFANNGWLQELPGPLTKLTWDNAALIAPETAKKLGIKNATIVRLKYRGRQLELPAFILPGQAPGSIGVQLGYGRTAAGIVGGSKRLDVDPVGVDVSQIRFSDAMSVADGVEVVVTEKPYQFATTQDHFAIDKAGLEEKAGRIGDLVREGTLDEFNEHPDFAQHRVHHPPLKSLWKERDSDGHAWGMSVDLTKCVGCNACVVACQSENNVPVVGKDQVINGREMHWLRVDRYFKGEPESPQVSQQPVACHHCENAPCEQVCPVAATVHSDEGLNDMVYNRCIGTRYCGNNCPYKVRRFNFFDYNEPLEDASRELQQLVINPEVTVRSRGVMEKCTYCVQRIQSVKIDARNNRRSIADGEIQTACQQACPAEAIEFGDLNDKNSRVAKAHASPRAYGMLAELNVKPRTNYLARIRNPHPWLIGDADQDMQH